VACRILKSLGLLLALLALAAGCGGSDAPKASDEEKVEKALADVEERLEDEGPLVGLGEASPPLSDATAWETDFSKHLVVMYDRETESWWQQFSGEALVGELAGAKLRQLPVRIVAWDEFRDEHPAGLVLDRDTGFSRDYGTNPYAGYDRIDSSPIFATRNEDDDRLLPKERVVYVEVSGDAFAVPFLALAKRRMIEIETDAGELVVRWRGGVASALDEAAISAGRDVGAASVELAGEPMPFSEPFWFAVAAFRADVEIVDD